MCMVMMDFKTVEFFGLCGAGKTTFLDQLPKFLSPRACDLLQDRCVPPIGKHARFHSLSVLLQAAMRAPVGVFQLLALDNRGLSLFQKIGYRLASISGQERAKTRLLVDSGVIQPLITYVIEDQKGNYPLPVAALMGALPMPRLAIYFTVSPEIAMSRYVEREAQDLSRPRRRNHGGGEFIERFNQGRVLCETLATYLQARDVHLIKIDLSHGVNHCDFASLAEVIEAVLD